MHINTALSSLSRTTSNHRQLKGLTIEELAAQRNCGVSESTIRRIEKASQTGYNPTLNTLVNLANVLRVPLTTLVGTIQAARRIKA